MRTDLLEAYRQDLELRNLATVKGHVLVASLWLRWCDEQGIDPLAVSREDLRAYLASRRAAGNKTTTLQKTFSGLSVFYTFLEDAE